MRVGALPRACATLLIAPARLCHTITGLMSYTNREAGSMSRPALETSKRRRKMFSVRVTAQQLEQVRSAAARSGQLPSRWAVDVLMRASRLG